MLERDFLGFINDNQLFGPADKVLLAVSGGLDSIVMAELFYKISQPFAIAHVNFGLRGTESDADAFFVQNKAEQYGVPFHLTRFDTAAVANERSISIQMAARELRYAWFQQLLQEHQYGCVATAHHQNDVLETILLNLTRGTGIAGLRGIAVKQNQVVRPLLFATRDQLAAYAETQRLTYREDSSNAEDKYARNRIRHHVVPVLTEVNPGLWQTLPRTTERLRASETLVQAELTRSWQAIHEQYGEKILLPISKLLTLAERAFCLSEWLRPMGFTVDQTEQMSNVLSQPVGQVFLSATYRVTHERNGLMLEPLRLVPDYELKLTEWPAEPIAVAGQFTLAVEFIDKPTDFQPVTKSNVAVLDAEKLTFPITIRPWRQGDRFRPLGLSGHKLVSDLLNDLKLSRSEREKTAVLLSGDSIAWVIGRRIDHRFRITQATRRICQLTFLN
ncbi:tRNA lysidine(34) synthetase TilS [Spirosoma validum]|uniref:tRNA(Ile)-lysidine synthase n=1 Tax=Spirosoma validum TaxID=2771355 RepID=A0A927GF18_9BACT|nr:tRNA lysidine(34) synthetase TilS [Spirosoma validum]MBD2755407.1 tRNA lysidine(34) synthetase TilS [Spirosoma validum]